jgi:hypothetical protein
VSDQPQPIGPQPVPVTVTCGRVTMPDGTPGVALQLHTFTGVHVTFLPADFARQVANMLLVEAGGIVLPTGPLLSGGAA